MVWYKSGKPMPKRTTYQEWYDEQVAKNGQGSVEAERKKAYNRIADLEQFDSYAERLGSDAPDSFTDFQSMKYSQPEAWAETKSFYSYKGRVPEATKKDFSTYSTVKKSGVYGTARVPAEPIDTSVLTLDTAHIAERNHGVTLDEARSFIDQATFSLRRRHWSGETFVNYYSSDGASYVRLSDNVIRTSFKNDEFDTDRKSVV